jgi:PHD/YefM family antitoxin component YafN of YafNO toxin-antitoxin module
MNIMKKYIMDEHGTPKEVIIPVDDYKKTEELLGLDLSDESIQELREAQKDRENGNKDAYVDLESI